MNHTLAYAPKSEAFIKKANAFLTYTTGRVLVKFNVEGLEFYAVAKKGEKLESVFEREVVTRGGEVVKKYYPEFNAWQIEYIKIGNKVLDKNIHFFMKNGIPMVSNGEKIEFPNASEITIDGNATEFNFKRVDFQVNPTNMQQMGELYQGGIEISQGAREIMNGQRSREQIACAHGETRTHTIEANGNNMVAINHETGEITSVAEINSEKRVQPIKEEKIILQPIYQEQNYEAFGRIEISSQYQNITGLNRDTVNERRQIEERADTLEFGGLRVANDNAQYKVEIVQENGYGRIKICKEAEYARTERQTQDSEMPQIQRSQGGQIQEPKTIQIEHARIKQKKPKKAPDTTKNERNQEIIFQKNVPETKGIAPVKQKTSEEGELPKEKGILLKFNQNENREIDETQIKPKKKKDSRKTLTIRKTVTVEKEEKPKSENRESIRKERKGKEIKKNGRKSIKIEKLEVNNFKKEERIRKKNTLEKTKLDATKLQIQKTQMNEKTQKKTKRMQTRKEYNAEEIRNNKIKIQKTNRIDNQRKGKERQNIREVTDKKRDKKEEKKGKKIKKYFFNELLGLFTKRKKVNKLKKVV